MHAITILVLTIWLHVGNLGGATARTVVAPNDAECKANASVIAESVKKGVQFGGKMIVPDHVSAICLTFEEPRDA